jgi:hypothetical protein
VLGEVRVRGERRRWDTWGGESDCMGGGEMDGGVVVDVVTGGAGEEERFVRSKVSGSELADTGPWGWVCCASGNDGESVFFPAVAIGCVGWSSSVRSSDSTSGLADFVLRRRGEARRIGRCAGWRSELGLGARQD